jgi:hypothetical protein
MHIRQSSRAKSLTLKAKDAAESLALQHEQPSPALPAGSESASGSGSVRRPQKRKTAQTEPAVNMLSTTNYAASGVPDERVAGGFSHSAMFDFAALGADVFDAQLQQFFVNK